MDLWHTDQWKIPDFPPIFNEVQFSTEFRRANFAHVIFPSNKQVPSNFPIFFSHKKSCILCLHSQREQYGTLFEKTNFCPKIQFWQNYNIFTSFSPNFFLTIFLVKWKLSTAKKSKTPTFSRVFHPKTTRQFSQQIKVEFLDKKWSFRTVCIESFN